MNSEPICYPCNVCSFFISFGLLKIDAHQYRYRSDHTFHFNAYLRFDVLRASLQNILTREKAERKAAMHSMRLQRNQCYTFFVWLAYILRVYVVNIQQNKNTCITENRKAKYA